MKRTLPALIAVLALAGLADSIYMAAVDLEVAGVGLPEVCRIGAGSCEAVFDSSQTSVAGLPTAILGAVYFAFILGIAVARVTTGKWFSPLLMTPVLVVGLGLSGYLMYSLVVEMASLCPFCIAAHAINTAIVVLFAVSVYEDGVTSRAAETIRERLRPRREPFRG